MFKEHFKVHIWIVELYKIWPYESAPVRSFRSPGLTLDFGQLTWVLG